MQVKPGFIVFENGDKITWSTPHSGPALETPTSRDDNSDTVASLCWMKIGGRLVISTMPRKRALGIDFNRDSPPLRKSLEYHRLFSENNCPEKLEEYRKKYAFCAADRRDHERRMRIYRRFWSAVRESGRTVVFVHRKFTRLKNFPSIMDIVAYEGYGFSKNILAPLVKRIDRKYADFLLSIKENYVNAILLEEKRTVERIAEIYGGFSLDSMGIEYKNNLLDDLLVIRRLADSRRVERLDRHFTQKNFMLAVRSALVNGGTPRITVESIFRGEHGRSQKRDIFRLKNVISIESNAFINYWYPNEASDIILDIVNEIKPMRKITEYLQDASSEN
ncbi:MAG: hypothetical protein JXC85_01260 [Candidatus Aenigmarchaeota archaeon]|nr:hypothetical protein [Candidatus Aenigmarchaeota archaeon]